jgi:hypothetical protein
VSGERHTPAALHREKASGTHYTGGWVGFGAGLDGCGKSRPTGFDPRTVQPVASRYMGYATPATVTFMNLENVVLLVTVIPHLLKSVYTTTMFRLRLVSRHSI